MKCKNCSKPLNYDQQRTGYCSKDCAASNNTIEPHSECEDNIQKKSYSKYQALKIISNIYRVLAFVSGLAGIILIIAGFITGVFVTSIYGLVLITIGVIANLAISEGIVLFIDIERNTRRTNELLEEQKEVEQ